MTVLTAVHYDAEAERTRLMKEKAKKIKKLKDAASQLKKKDSKLFQVNMYHP